MTDTYYLVSVTGGDCFTHQAIDGYGQPRIFEGQSMYIYQLMNQLLRLSDDLTESVNILPTGTGTVTAMTQLPGANSLTEIVTLVFSPSGAFHQTYPESGEWATSGSLPDTFLAADAVTSLGGNFPILAGNSTADPEPRIVLATHTPPYNFSRSDTGLPATVPEIASITDLDIVE